MQLEDKDSLESPRSITFLSPKERHVSALPGGTACGFRLLKSYSLFALDHFEL
jgi:hypothetical protein